VEAGFQAQRRRRELLENALIGNSISGGVAYPRPDIQADEKSSYNNQSTPLETLIQWFEAAEEASQDARKASERDRDYYDHKQLTASELAELEKRGQPDVIINRIQPKINYLIGYEASNRTDPRAFPRTPADEEASEAATDGLRYYEDAADLKTMFSLAWECMLIEGYGGLELVIEEGARGDRELKAVAWDWDRLFYDPHSRKPDFSDARYLGGVIWLDVEDAKERWPSAAEAIETTLNERTLSQTYDDRPAWQQWSTSGKRKRIRIVQMYHKEGGQWMHCTFTKGGKLESISVPFRDQDGRSWCPMFLQSAFVNRKNERYGLVRSMISVQDEINKRRSKALHRLSQRQVRSERGAVDDVELAKRELAKPDGWVETNPGFEFELLNQNDQLAAELQMLQEAKNEIELMGPNSALQGKDEDAPSGRAILANQQGGQTEITLLIDRHRHLKRRVYEGCWNLIRQYKDEEWWVRVTDDEKKARFVGFNRPVRMIEDLAKRAEQSGVPQDQFQAQIEQLMATDQVAAQRLQSVVRVENQPSRMFMDITIEDVPDVANVAEEQFQALVKLAPAVVFPPKVYLKASSLRNKDELIEELEGQQMSPEEQALKQEVSGLELEKLRNEVAKMAAEVEKMRAETAAKMAELNAGSDVVEDPGPAPAEVEIEAMKTEAVRIKAEAELLKSQKDVEQIELKRIAEREKHALEMERIAEQRARDRETEAQKVTDVAPTADQDAQADVSFDDPPKRKRKTVRFIRDDNGRPIGAEIEED
jgi:hypothetical protein